MITFCLMGVYPWQKCMGKVSQSTHFSPYRLFCIKGYYKLREFLEAWSYFKVFSLPTMPWHCVFLCIGCCYYFHWCRDEKQTSTVYGGWHFRWNLKKKEKKKKKSKISSLDEVWKWFCLLKMFPYKKILSLLYWSARPSWSRKKTGGKLWC